MSSSTKSKSSLFSFSFRDVSEPCEAKAKFDSIYCPLNTKYLVDVSRIDFLIESSYDPLRCVASMQCWCSTFFVIKLMAVLCYDLPLTSGGSTNSHIYL